MTRHTDFLQTLTIVACAGGKDVLVGDDWHTHAKTAAKRGWITITWPNLDTTTGRRQLQRSGEVWDSSGEKAMRLKITARGRRVYKRYETFAKEVRGIK